MASLHLSVAVLVIFGVAYVAAYPRSYANRKIREVELGAAINQTVCPIVVVINEDKSRIPQRIKMLKCAQDPLQVCIKRNIPHQSCCESRHNNHVMECVELHDKVLVKYPQSDSSVKIMQLDVPVGCTCLLSPSVEGNTLPPPT